jgi:hypothetical protein
MLLAGLSRGHKPASRARLVVFFHDLLAFIEDLDVALLAPRWWARETLK